MSTILALDCSVDTADARRMIAEVIGKVGWGLIPIKNIP